VSWTEKQIDDAVFGAKAEIKRLRAALDDRSGKIQEPIEYPISAIVARDVKSVGTPSYSSWGNNTPRPGLAMAAAKAAYESSLPLVEKNRAICAENARIVAQVLEVITNAGFPQSIKVRSTSRKKYDSGWDWSPAGWKSIGSLVRTSDQWDYLEKQYHEFMRKCSEWKHSIEEAAAKERREVETAEATKRAEVEKEAKRIALCLKYGLDPMASTDDVREAILAKDKYLRLAYWMQRNRSDWTDGPHYAEIGLRGFDATDELEREIVKCITGHIDDWQGDGRVFRDCEWSYDKLFGMAEPGIKKDLDSLPSEDF
jgi:hypothetical protein